MLTRSSVSISECRYSHLNAQLSVILGQVLCHALGERGDQGSLLRLHLLAHLSIQIIHLPRDRPHFNVRIHEAGGPDNLLHDLALAGLVSSYSAGVADT